jgi:D-isomer specific 2-hydroxyacid dehydrogenase, NAD binding domain
MKPSAHFVNDARGQVVNGVAPVEALAMRHIAGAGIQVTAHEPLMPGSPLWGREQVLITPRIAGETRRYEDNLIEIPARQSRPRRGEEPCATGWYDSGRQPQGFARWHSVAATLVAPMAKNARLWPGRSEAGECCFD